MIYLCVFSLGFLVGVCAGQFSVWNFVDKHYDYSFHTKEADR